jgi:hypothetical protein
VNAYTIDTLAALDPSALIPNISATNISTAASPIHEIAKVQFLSQYAKVAFGWYIASQFANACKGFPIPMLGRDGWVFKAYLMQLDPWSYYNRDIATAYHLAYTPKGASDLGAKLKAMILSVTDMDPCVHLRKVAKLSGLPYNAVEAFESLFYNVLDRRLDGFYISAEVYPETRIIELAESYMADSSLGDLLKRAGYNQRDLDMTTYLVGIGDKEYMAKIASGANSESELNNQIMGNGLILAKANLLNTRSVGLGRAASMMVASRQGGGATEEQPLSGISSFIAAEFKQATILSQTDVTRRLRQDAGMVTVVV